MNSGLAILVCRNLEREVKAAVGGERDDVQVRAFPGRCTVPGLTWNDLQAAAGEGAPWDRICLFGCSCLTGLPDPPDASGRWRICRMGECFELFLGSGLGEFFRRQGAWLLTPGWLGDWRNALPAARPDEGDQPAGDLPRKLLLLDSGVDPEARENLDLFATRKGLPADILPVGLDHLRLVVENAILEWRLDRKGRLAVAELSEKQYAQEILKTSELKYRSLFEDSPVSLWEEDFSQVRSLLEDLRGRGVVDFDAYFRDHPQTLAECARRIRVIDVNRATLEMFRVGSKKDLLGNLHRILTDSSLAGFRKKLVALASGATRFQTEGVNRTLDGEEKFVSLRLSVAPDHRESLERVVVSLVDLTERKKGEEALRKSETKYRSLFEDSPVSLWEEDLSEVSKFLDDLSRQGVADLEEYFTVHPEAVDECARLVRILDVNRATLEMFQVPSKELLLGSLDRLLTEDSRAQFREGLVAFGRGETRFEIEGVNRTPGGETRMVNMRVSVVPGCEKTLEKVVISLIDITERKKAEEALREINRIRSEFISTAAHELSTPVAAVLGYAELLLNQGAMGGFSSQQVREFLTIIYEKAEGLTRVVDELLDLSRIESGLGIPLHKAPFDIVGTLAKAVSHYRRGSGRFRFELALPESPVRVEVDRGKIIQAVENLLSNAVKYSPRGGTILIAGRVEEKFFQITVQDEGIGMNEEQVARIFEKFYRVDPANAAAPGLGLGMCIVQNIVEAHGGRVWVKSRPGEGTRVSFTLPLETEGPVPPAESHF